MSRRSTEGLRAIFLLFGSVFFGIQFGVAAGVAAFFLCAAIIG